MTAPSKLTDADKIHWEAMKLKAEAEQQSRPFFLAPAFWVSGATAMAALLGIGIQWLHSSQQYNEAKNASDLSKVEKAQAEFDTKLAKQEFARISQERMEQETIRDKLLDENKSTQSQLAKLDGQRKQLESVIADMVAKKGDPQVNLKRAEESLKALNVQHGVVDAGLKTQAKIFSQLPSKK